MQVSKISPISNNNNIVERKITQANKSKDLDSKSSGILPSIYPANYYLSFQSKVRSKYLKNFEAAIEEFYETFKDTNAKTLSMEFRYSSLVKYQSKSRRLDQIFERKVNESLLATPLPPIDDKLLLGAVMAGLTGIISVDYNDKNELKDKAEPLAAEFIDILKTEGKLPEEINITDPNEEADIYSTIYAAAKQLISDIDIPASRACSSFIDEYYNYLEAHRVPLFDEKVKEKLLEILDEPIFQEYVNRMRAIDAQIKVCGNNTMNLCAEDLYKDILNNQISPFNNSKFYEFLSQKDLSVDYMLEAHHGRFSSDIKEMFQNSGCSEKQKVLLLNPVFTTKLIEFNEFLKTTGIDTEQILPYELLMKFRDYLGKETIYRGVKEENINELVNRFQTQGERALILRDTNNALDTIKYYLDVPSDDRTVFNKLVAKIKGYTTEFISTTSIYGLASSLHRSSFLPTDPVVVLKTEIPKLDVIKQEGRYDKIQVSRLNHQLIVGKKKYPYVKYCADIESFVPFVIPAKNMTITKDYEKIDFGWDYLYY